MKRTFLALLLLSSYLLHTAPVLQAQTNVLFIGNSYTEVNNLPQMTTNVARSMGFEMTYSSNTPGGCTFSQHCTNQSMTLIQQGGWDFVVLQEQSQYPSFPQSQVEAEVFPYAAQLVEAVYTASPCAEPMFYMTWGRRDGDQYNAQFFPVLGTYEGMDSMLYERYVYMAESNDASVCPVGRVWRSLRENHPELELYQSDGSHPSIAGTYAAACSFAVMFFHGDPTTITYIPEGLGEEVAQTILLAVSEVVYQQQPRWQRPMPHATLDITGLDDGVATLSLHAEHADSLFLDFGDGTQTTFRNTDSTILHSYTDSGDYLVTLIATRHCMSDTVVATLHISLPDTTGIAQFSIPNSQFSIIPNPSAFLPSITLNGEVLTPDNADISVFTPDGRTLPYSNDLPSGLYIIQVRKGERVLRSRFVKL